MRFNKFVWMMCLGLMILFPLSGALAEPVEIHWWHAQRGPREVTLNKIVDA